VQLTFRWFGQQDPVTLDRIRQIPGVRGVVSALYDVAPGEVWQRARVEQLAATVDRTGLQLAVIESIPVHEDIKLGRPTRDRLLDHYAESVRSLGAAGIPVLCYNFMPVFDWLRTDLALRLPDGSTTLSFDARALESLDLSRGTGVLPGWATGYDSAALQELRAAYAGLDAEQLWEHLAYFLERVVPVAEESGVRLGLHPDDPPWPLLGLPRIITSRAAYERLLSLAPSPANGITFCTGSLGACPENDVPGMARHFAAQERIHFAHCRNVRVTGPHSFYETPHPSSFGDIDMAAVLAGLRDGGFRGPLRPDHGRMIWGENGRPGYGLYDRALGAMYLAGLWEGLNAGRPA
jgi:mannonate dehydratase